MSYLFLLWNFRKGFGIPGSFFLIPLCLPTIDNNQAAFRGRSTSGERPHREGRRVKGGGGSRSAPIALFGGQGPGASGMWEQHVGKPGTHYRIFARLTAPAYHEPSPPVPLHLQISGPRRGKGKGRQAGRDPPKKRLGGQLAGARAMTSRARDGAGRRGPCPSPASGRRGRPGPPFCRPLPRSRRAVVVGTQPCDKVARPSGTGTPLGGRTRGRATAPGQAVRFSL